MNWWASRWCLAALCCAALVGCEESVRLLCEDLNGSYNFFTLEVYRGGNQSLNLPINVDWQKLVKKCDPETKTWKEIILAAPGETHSLTNKTTSISLVDRNFSVWNAEKNEEGLYKIEGYLNNICLAVVTVICWIVLYLRLSRPRLMDLQLLPPRSQQHLRSPLQEENTVIWIGLSVGIFILIVIGFIGVWVWKLIKSKCRPNPNKDTCEVDPEKPLSRNGSHQQQESTAV